MIYSAYMGAVTSLMLYIKRGTLTVRFNYKKQSLRLELDKSEKNGR